MEAITGFLNVRDAIQAGRQKGTVLGTDYEFDNSAPESDTVKSPYETDYNKEYNGEFYDDENETKLEKIKKYLTNSDNDKDYIEQFIIYEINEKYNELKNLKDFSFGKESPVNYYYKKFKVKVGSQKEEINKLDVDTLFNEGTPAPFGDLNTMTTVHNPDVRTALELPFTMSNNDIENLKYYINYRISYGLNDGKDFDLIPHKANMYSTGCFFKPHVDTPIADNMLGTLVITMSTKYEGGDLVIQHNGITKTYNYNDLGKGYLGFVGFYGNCVHEVTPITKGRRVTFTFYIMNKGKGVIYNDELITKKMDELREYIELYSQLGKKSIGFFTNHKYTMNGVEHLKGIDQDVYKYFQSVSSDLDKHLPKDVANIVKSYSLDIEIQMLPVLIYYYKSEDYSYPEYNEYRSTVVACTEEDFNYIQGKTKSPPEHNLPSYTVFVGNSYQGQKKEIESQTQDYVEYTGNESQPYNYNGIYVSAVMVLKFLNNKKETKESEKKVEEESDFEYQSREPGHTGCTDSDASVSDD